MKLSSLGPFTVIPAVEGDEVASMRKRRLKTEQVKPIDPDSHTQAGVQDEEARKGLSRLIDFISAHRQKTADPISNSVKIRQMCFGRYQQLDETVVKLNSLGLNMKHKI